MLSSSAATLPLDVCVRDTHILLPSYTKVDERAYRRVRENVGGLVNYELPSAPLSIGGVLDNAIRLYRYAIRHCWALA